MRGFTIIEIVVAVFILAVGIAAVLNIFPLGVQLIGSAKTASIAVQLGQEKIEEMASLSYTDLGADIIEEYGSISGFEEYKRVTSISCVRYDDLSEVSCDYDSTNDPEPLKKIEVTLFWRSVLGATENNLNLISLIAKR